VPRATARKPPPGRGSLIVVGTGITGVGQTTLEAVACMQQAERLFYSVVEPTTELWIRGLNPQAISLSDLYGERKPRAETYAEMTGRLVTAVHDGFQVCAAFYGHPGMLVTASHQAIRLLRRQGYPARMLPGVSADGCLIADLGFNPGDCGMQSYEATEFLLSRRRFDPTGGLVLWQVGVLGESAARQNITCRPERLQTLTDTLQRYYPPAHRVVLYYAPTFPANPPIVKRVQLAKLPRARVYPMAMLYVPPLPRRPQATHIARWFDEN
jgi:Tetrapyrrole (Corrin/Porphyrin) Methylases